MMGAEDAHRGAQKQRVAFDLTFLLRYQREADVMLSHIVTVDETWCPVSQFNKKSNPFTGSILARRKGKFQTDF
jgi:hypothetical protein